MFGRLVEKGSININDIDFPNDIYSRNFPSSNYVQRPHFLHRKKFEK